MEHPATKQMIDSHASIRRDLSRFRLLVVEGPDAGRFCELGTDPVVVGTDPSAQLRLVDETVSRRHLTAQRNGLGVDVLDLNSTNGTFYEGSRIRQMDLCLGGRLRLGQTVIKVVPLEEALAAEPSSAVCFGGVLSQNRRMREIFATAADVAKTDLTILIQGETGTGKEALAEAVHRTSSRGGGPFVVVDCTTIPRELVESEFFGHKKGAFTGAVSDRRGFFEQANGGTLFIDEVGDLPLESQPKLLRVLECRQMKPVGSDQLGDLDIRVMAATRQDLRQQIDKGAFREDLYYRLAVMSFHLPPLRERLEDLPQLIEHFAKRASSGSTTVRLYGKDLVELAGYAWPGNVRELRNVVERAVALLGGKASDPGALVAELARGLGEAMARQGARVRGGRLLPFHEAKSQVVDAFEKSFLHDLIERHRGNVSKAALEARMDRHHLRDLLKKHGIKNK